MEKLKETEFPWNPEEYITVYFTKLHKDQEQLEKDGINWDDLQNFVQAVEKMCSIKLLGEFKMIDWENKSDADKTWKTCESYFKEL